MAHPGDPLHEARHAGLSVVAFVGSEMERFPPLRHNAARRLDHVRLVVVVDHRPRDADAGALLDGLDEPREAVGGQHGILVEQEDPVGPLGERQPDADVVVARVSGVARELGHLTPGNAARTASTEPSVDWQSSTMTPRFAYEPAWSDPRHSRVSALRFELRMTAAMRGRPTIGLTRWLSPPRGRQVLA